MDGRSLEAGVRRVIVLGGLGLFGRTAIEELRRIGLKVVTASRSAAAEMRIDANDGASIRKSITAGDIVLDSAGPFHMRSLALIEVAIEVGFDVIDLNDDLGYAESIVALEPQINEVGIRVLSSASSVSAIAAAVVTFSGISLPSRVTSFLAPASRYTANVGTAQSLWRSVGRPVRVLVDCQLQTRVGWTETRRFSMPPPLGQLKGHLFESADAINLPRCWPSLREVAMYVDSNTLGVNSLLEMAAHSEPLRELMQRKVEWGTWLAKTIGSSAGGVGYEIEDSDGHIAKYAIVASSNSFLTAVAPAVLAARAIATDKYERRGLIAADHHVAPDELFEYLAQNGITFSNVN
jgi:saccharopine dehydrogenase-like NADP-dependent oxidoreductase